MPDAVAIKAVNAGRKSLRLFDCVPVFRVAETLIEITVSFLRRHARSCSRAEHAN